MSHAVEARIDLTALGYNVRKVRELAPGRKIMAVIKANAYGHGMVRVAGALEGVDALAVARVDEAVMLRDAGIDRPIVLLAGFFDTAELDAVIAYGLHVVVHHEYQLCLLEQAHVKQPLPVWLKVDTGMHRLGIAESRVDDCWRRLQACPAVGAVGLMTHLASADELDSDQTPQQLARFAQATRNLDAPRSIANSAAVMKWPASLGDWVRPGVMLYGASPFCDSVGEREGLKPVMTLSSRLIAVNRFHRGDPIGYGATWVCPEDMPVGVVACGYGDGYPRHAGSGTSVLIRGQQVPLVGRVSMDTLCVDLRGCPQAGIGDSVTLWGRGLPVETVARRASTIAYELLCGVTGRVKVNGVESSNI